MLLETSENRFLTVTKFILLRLFLNPKIVNIYYYNRWIQLMIEGLVKILIFDKMATTQKIGVLWRNLHFRVIEFLIVNWQIWLRKSFRRNFTHRLWKYFEKKVLGADYFKLKNSYKYTHISETIFRINFKYSKNSKIYIVHTIDIYAVKRSIFGIS